jgi:hypothetical protein
MYYWKTHFKTCISQNSPKATQFLEWVMCDICSLVQVLSGHYRYFIVIIDASRLWSHVCLLCVGNHAFDKILNIENLNKFILIENTTKLFSHFFNDYCMTLELKLNTRSHMSALKWPVEFPIKKIKLIWQSQPTAYQSTFPLQLVSENLANIFHIPKFRCTTRVSISPPQRIC